MGDHDDLKGRVAVVTGGTRGIGRAIARALAANGVRVHVFDLAPGEEVNGCRFHHVDITDAASIDKAVQQIEGPVTLVVNNAGITRDRSVEKMSDDEWQSVLSVNLTGTFNVVRALSPGMRKAGRGAIVNISSINGLRGKFGQANYCASKAGLIGLTKVLARELGPKGVTVNCIAPGLVMTEMTLAMPKELLAKSKSESVLPEVATPEDIANVVLFLLSKRAWMITGQVIQVDSGQYL